MSITIFHQVEFMPAREEWERKSGIIINVLNCTIEELRRCDGVGVVEKRSGYGTFRLLHLICILCPIATSDFFYWILQSATVHLSVKCCEGVVLRFKD